LHKENLPWFEQGALRALFLISTKPPPILDRPDDWSANFNGFLARCVVRDPVSRPTAKELTEHIFFQAPVNYSVLASLVEESSLMSTEHLGSDGSSTGESANSSEAFDPIQSDLVQKEEKVNQPNHAVSWMDVLRETKSIPLSQAPKPVANKKAEEKKDKEKDKDKDKAEEKKDKEKDKTIKKEKSKNILQQLFKNHENNKSKDTEDSSATYQPKNWLEFFTTAGLVDEDARTYTKIFEENEIEINQAADLSTEILKELGVKIGHLMKIMKHVKQVKRPV